MNEMKNSTKYKPWIVDVGVEFDLVLPVGVDVDVDNMLQC